MNPRNLLFVVASVIVMGASLTLMSQGLTDGVRVTLPYPVTVDDVVLEPGEYEIRRPSQTNDQILRFFSNDKLRYQTVALTVPAAEQRPPEETKVILHHIGDNYYFDKLWIEGKTYGYEFPLPEKARALQRELAVTVPAKYQSAQATQAETPASAPASERSEALTPPQPDPAQNAQNREVPALESRDSANIERQDSNINAAPREQQEVAPISVASRQDSVQSDAQRNQGAAANAATRVNDELPATASGWLVYLVAGSFLILLAGLCRKLVPQE
jgi:hypothetical protein